MKTYKAKGQTVKNKLYTPVTDNYFYNNNNYYNKLQLRCQPVTVVILHVYKI